MLNLERRLWMLRTSDIHIFDNYMIVQLKQFRVEAPKTFLKRRRTYEMFQGLKLGFQARAHVKRYKTSDDFLSLQTKGEKLNC